MNKVAVLGLGWWGSKLFRNFARHEKVTQVVGVDPSEIRRKEIIENFGAETGTNANAIFNDSGIDAVVVATPPPTHFQLTKSALLADKDVLLTKPPTETIDQLTELVNIAESHGRIFMMDSTFVYSDPVRKIRDLLTGGLFKEVRYVQSLRYGNDLRMHHISRLRGTMLDNGVSVIDDLLFHDIAILSYLFPHVAMQPESVQKVNMLSSNLCDTAFIRMRANGFPVHIGLSWTLPERRRELLIGDNEKQLIFDDLKTDKKLELFWIDEKWQEFVEHGNEEPLFAVVDHFINCIATREQPLTDGRYMLKVMREFKAVLEFA
jgi:predicted dehydrogenase